MKERGEMLIIIKRLWLFISRYSRNFVLFLSFFFFSKFWWMGIIWFRIKEQNGKMGNVVVACNVILLRNSGERLEWPSHVAE